MKNRNTESICRLRSYFLEQDGMNSVELVVAICVIAVAAAVFIPFYVCYVQQARLLSEIMPPLMHIERNISLFYYQQTILPSNNNLREILDQVDTQNLNVTLSSGVVTLTVIAPQRANDLNILDGQILIASPVINTNGTITAWHLAGELADRLNISH